MIIEGVSLKYLNCPLLKMISMMENVEEEMLKIAARRGNIGASRDDLYKELRGIAYSDLEEMVQELERRGWLTIDWLGTYDFVVTITPQGLEQLN